MLFRVFVVFVCVFAWLCLSCAFVLCVVLVCLFVACVVYACFVGVTSWGVLCFLLSCV